DANGQFHVALKHMKDLKETGYNVQSAWESEAEALVQINRLDNKHLIRRTGAFKAGKNYYIMFEWADGGTLRDVWERQNVDHTALNGHRILQVLEQLHGLAEALSKLHNKANNAPRRGGAPGSLSRAETILASPSLNVPKVQLQADGDNSDNTGEEHWRHGDLKPDNILLFRDKTSPWLGTLKIADLGLAKQHAFATAKRDLATEQKYSTFHYEAPEVIIKRHDPRSRLYDIWSMGCIIFEFVIWILYGYPGLEKFYGEKPPTGRNTLYFTVNQREDSAQVSDVVKNWMDHMLRLDPECKGQSPSVVKDLIKLVKDHLLVFDHIWELPDDGAFATAFLRGLDTELSQPSQATSLCESCARLHLLTDGILMKDTFGKMKELSEKCELHCLILRGCGLEEYQETSMIEVRRAGHTLELNGDVMSSLSVCKGLGILLCVRTIEIFDIDHSIADRTGLDAAVDSPGGIRIGRAQLPEMNSTLFYKLMLHWIQDCDSNHDECKPLKPDSKCLPTRLLDVGRDGSPGNGSLVRLVVTEEDGLHMSRNLRYIALSHPWGDSQEHDHFCTTPENLYHRLTHGIAFDQLPGTFKHAVQVTHSLNIRYLWIDSLCIIQGHRGDFDIEAKNMQAIFSSAYFVIAASRASGTSSGFLGPRPARKFIRFGEFASPIYVCEAIDDFQHDVIEGDLNKRGWVLQERALARRTIYFTKNQVYWECGRGNSNEAAFLGDANFPDVAFRSSKGARIHYYQRLYETYSRLQFTKAYDRPIAIAGLEQRLVNAFATHGGYGAFEVIGKKGEM
ncbi:hypothetical protein N0V84_010573, partial [Fusarium piperis]